MLKRYSRILLVMFATMIAVFLMTGYFFQTEKSAFHPTSVTSQLSGTKGLETAYLKWAAQHEQTGGDHNVAMSLGWSKAYSREFSQAQGLAKLDLIDGSVTVEVRGLEDPDIQDVWLVDNQPAPGHSAMPEPGDHMLRVGALKPSGDKVTLHAELGNAFQSFEVDLVVVTRSGKDPTEAGVLFGSPGLFQRLYTRAQSGRLPPAESTPDSHLEALGPKPAYADVVVPSFEPLVVEGANLFFNEPFEGNGRTCGTCHPAENNLTIDPTFIAQLKQENPNDPLFVAEFIDELKEDFEKPQLMHDHGLILENTNGFNNLKKNFTMRGVPHILGISTSLTASDGSDGTTVPPNERTGWSGDGAPGSGTLREFANGAIKQHFTKTLKRKVGVDFRFATEDELNALEAFQRSLGRQEELNIMAMSFKGDVVEQGRALFLTTGKCNFCHANAGANVSFGDQSNRNFDIGVENLPKPPGVPEDDGFGKGSGTFNTVSIVEAADTGPFFHNNTVETIEEVVNFYNDNNHNNSNGAGNIFSDSPAGLITGPIDLTGDQVVAIAAFLRAINALENIRSCMVSAKFAKGIEEFQTAQALLILAYTEIEDAISVLESGELHPLAVKKLGQAFDSLETASLTSNSGQRNGHITGALSKLEQARSAMVLE